MAQMFSRRARLYCISAGVPGLLGLAALMAVSLVMLHGAQGQYDPVVLWAAMSFSKKMISIFGLIFALWTPVLLAAHAVCRITADQLSGSATDLSRLFAEMARFLPAALVYSLVIGIPVMFGASVFVIPGMIVASLFALVVPVSIYESLGVLGALRRGLALGGHVLGKNVVIVFSSGLLIGLVFFLRAALFDRFLPDTYRVFLLVRFVLLYVPASLLLVLANICFTVLYHEARAKADSPRGPSSR
jgi:hypothetical protein